MLSLAGLKFHFVFCGFDQLSSQDSIQINHFGLELKLIAAAQKLIDDFPKCLAPINENVVLSVIKIEIVYR
jgi:hypothetical protein